jgi:hypothetical protein
MGQQAKSYKCAVDKETHLASHLAAIIQGNPHPVIDLERSRLLARRCDCHVPEWPARGIRYVRNRPRSDAACQSSDVNIVACTAAVKDTRRLTILPCLFVADMIATRCYSVASSSLQKLICGCRQNSQTLSVADSCCTQEASESTRNGWLSTQPVNVRGGEQG